MRIKKIIVSAMIPVLCVGALGLTGCREDRTAVAQAYDIFDTTDTYVPNGYSVDSEVTFFADSLCVGGLQNTDTKLVDDSKADIGGVFTLENGEISYAKNIYEKSYPASTTKLMTALLAFKYGDLDQVTTVSAEAMSGLDPESSLAGLKTGDQITLRECLYGLMLMSGNEAANVIAECVAGSIPEFVDMMNQEARKLGATGTHYVNAHGLSDDDHYTTAYDLYLIMNAAVEYDEFVDIISSKTHNANYKSADGSTVEVKWENTNYYLTGEAELPTGVTVFGGKTGTTKAAGNCLVLYSENQSGEPVISVVLKGHSKPELYAVMSEMVSNFSN